jgi:hypothetical protein
MVLGHKENEVGNLICSITKTLVSSAGHLESYHALSMWLEWAEKKFIMTF